MLQPKLLPSFSPELTLSRLALCSQRRRFAVDISYAELGVVLGSSRGALPIFSKCLDDLAELQLPGFDLPELHSELLPRRVQREFLQPTHHSISAQTHSS